MAEGLNKGVYKRLRVDDEESGRQDRQEKGQESSGMDEKMKESLGRGKLSNKGEDYRNGRQSCPTFLLKVLGDELRSVEARALVGLGKSIARHETENAKLRKLVIASHEKLTMLSEREDEIVRLREKLADAMVKFGEVAKSKDLHIQQLAQQVQAMELKAVELDSVVKEEPLLQESLAEKDTALVELTLRIENMTEAFEEKEREIETLKLQYETFAENYSKRSIKVIEALTNQKDKVVTLESENRSLKDEVGSLEKQKKSIQELYRQKDAELKELFKQTQANDLCEQEEQEEQEKREEQVEQTEEQEQEEPEEKEKQEEQDKQEKVEEQEEQEKQNKQEQEEPEDRGGDISIKTFKSVTAPTNNLRPQESDLINSLESRLKIMSRLKKRNAEIADLMRRKAAKKLKYKPSETDVAPWCYGANKGKSETRYTDTGWRFSQELEVSDIRSSSSSTDKGSQRNEVAEFSYSFKCGVCGFESGTKEKLSLHWEKGCRVQWSEQVGGHQMGGHQMGGHKVGDQKVGEETCEESDNRPGEESEDPKKQNEAAELFDQVMDEVPNEVQDKGGKVFEKEGFQSRTSDQVAQLPKKLEQELNQIFETTTSHSQTNKQSHPLPYWMEPLEDTEVFREIGNLKMSPTWGLIQQQTTKKVLVPEKELEEAVQNIFDL